MIHRNIIFPLFVAVLTLAACTDDDSTTADYTKVNSIEISGLEKEYAATAYLGEHLKITPTITTKNSDDEMTYTWLLYNEKTGTVVNGDTIKPTVIANTRNLDYEIAMAPGNYQLRLLAADKATGYTAYASANLSVATTFSEGFYILKETTDGKTELDQLTSKGQEGHDLLKQTEGCSMEGKPGAIWPIYGTDYINPDDKTIAQTNALAIVNDEGNVDVKRMSDFKTFFNRSTLLYGTMDDDDKIYAFFGTAMGYHFMVSSEGFRYTSATGKSTGQYGNPISSTGASMHIASDVTSYGGTLFWDETTKSLKVTDYNGGVSELTYENLTGANLTQNLSGYTCRHIGYNLMNSTGTYTALLKDSEGKNYLYLATPTFSSSYLSLRKALAPDSHLAKATSISTCGNQAKFIYCVDGGKLYACNFSEDDLPETVLQPEGIGNDETINFVTNQYWNGSISGGSNFDYLIVGTQKGDTYTLRFYQMKGGAPEGSPVKTISGQGKVKMVRYMFTNFDTTDWQFGINVYSITD